jgi:hypothetical protein
MSGPTPKTSSAVGIFSEDQIVIRVADHHALATELPAEPCQWDADRSDSDSGSSSFGSELDVRADTQGRELDVEVVSPQLRAQQHQQPHNKPLSIPRLQKPVVRRGGKSHYHHQRLMSDTHVIVELP